METILDRLVASKRERLAEVRRAVPVAKLREQLSEASPPKDFFGALAGAPTIRVIAEVKRGSPSAGAIRPDADAVSQARTYESGGAACISVLTEETQFRGSLDDLRNVSRAVSLPVLRKDFLFDEYQIYEARVAGASTVLLIAEVLRDSGLLRGLIELSRELGMEPLVEVYEEANVERVVAAGARVVGVNNRNLRTFEVDLGHTARLARLLPSSVLLVAESGIRTVEDVQYLADAGARAVLVGETLMRAADPAGLIRAFSNVPVSSGSRGT